MEERARPFLPFHNYSETNSFSTHIPDVFFQHFDNIIMYVSCYKMKEETIPDTILIVIELDWCINDPGYLMTCHIGIEYVCKQLTPILINRHIFVFTIFVS